MNDREVLHALVDAIQSKDAIRSLRSIAFDLLTIEERERRKSYLASMINDWEEELEAAMNEVNID